MPLRSALCALLVLAAALPTGAAARQRDRCHRADERTVALNHQLRVLVDRDSGYYLSCVRRTGHRTLLWEQDDIYVNGGLRAVAGRFVAYSVDSSPGCKADCPPDVRGSSDTWVTDAVSGRSRKLYDGVVTTVELARSGTVAWVAGQQPDNTLSLWALGSRIEILASGDVDDVRVGHGRLRWSDDAGPHSTPFA